MFIHHIGKRGQNGVLQLTARPLFSWHKFKHENYYIIEIAWGVPIIISKLGFTCSLNVLNWSLKLLIFNQTRLLHQFPECLLSERAALPHRHSSQCIYKCPILMLMWLTSSHSNTIFFIYLRSRLFGNIQIEIMSTAKLIMAKH